MKNILNELIEHKWLSKDLSKQVLIDLASKKYNASQMSAFITVYMMRPISLPELEGFKDAMLELCLPIKFNHPVMDVCGTGGDGKNTFNISTLSAFVVAAAGQAVAKHGNYGISSVSGSSNVLEYFGYEFTNSYDKLARSMDKANISFLHAPLFHPAMKHIAVIRRELGIRTFFNMLGPLVNPASPEIQLAGVYNLELARLYGYSFQKTNKRFVVIHDLQGYDEISLTGATKIFSNEGERQLEPEDLSLSQIESKDIVGGKTVEESARMFIEILKGNGTEAQNSVVIANAGMALFCADKKQGLETALARSKDTLLSGKGYQSFKNLLES